jgi:IclR family transcriptional regulator, KDG regulon repressor
MNNTVIQSIVRAVDILKCFEDIEELGVTEISNKLGLHKSTVFNIICTLERCQYLEKSDNSGKYRLGIELFRIGTKVDSDLRKIALPYLEDLLARFKETVNLVVRDREYVIYLEKIESPHSMRISTAVGSRLPVNATAVGKAILSGLPDAELGETVNGLSVARFTANTICDKDKLLASIKKVRCSGYAEDFEELEVGLMCVAAPIFNHKGKAFAAISVSGPTSRMLDSIRQEIGKSLGEVARQISTKFGYQPQDSRG